MQIATTWVDLVATGLDIMAFFVSWLNTEQLIIYTVHTEKKIRKNVEKYHA